MPACEWVAQSIEVHHKPNLSVKHPIPRDKTAPEICRRSHWWTTFRKTGDVLRSTSSHKMLFHINDSLLRPSQGFWQQKKKIIWSFRKIVGDNYKTVVHNHYSFFPLDETSVRREQGVFPRLSSHSSSSCSCSIPAKNNHMFSLIFNHTFLFSTSGQIPSLPQRNWVVVTCIFKDYSGFDKHKLGICQIWGAIKNSICCTVIKKKKRPVVYIKVNNVPFELNQPKKKKETFFHANFKFFLLES